MKFLQLLIQILILSKQFAQCEFTELLEFSSSVENTTFTWSFSTADTFLSGYNNETTNTGNLSTQNIFNDSNIPGQVIFQVNSFYC